MGFYANTRMAFAHLRDPENRLRDLLDALTGLHRQLNIYNRRIIADQSRAFESIEPVFSLIVRWRTDYGDTLRDIFEELKKQHRDRFKLASLLNHLGCFMGWEQDQMNCSISYKGGMYTQRGINPSAIFVFFSRHDSCSFDHICSLPTAAEKRQVANTIAYEFLRSHLIPICCAISEIELHFQNVPQKDDAECEE